MTENLGVTTPTELAGILRDHFGLAVRSVFPLRGETDSAARVETDDEAFVVKVSPPGGRAEADLELAVLSALATQDLGGVAAPRLVPTIQGATAAQVAEHGTVRVCNWVAGQPWRVVQNPSMGLASELGAAAARIDVALRNVDPVLAERTHMWDLRSAADVIRAGLAATTPHQQSVLAEVADRVEQSWGTRGSSLPAGVVHQDLNDYNVLVERADDGTWRISGVIDVGDSLHTARIAEVAVAAGYAGLRSADPVGIAAAVAAGYDEVLSLTDDELAVLMPLATARLAMNLATWSTRHASGVNIEYAAERMALTWPALTRLAAVPPAVAEARVRAACGRHVPIASTPAGDAPLLAVGRWHRVDLTPSGELDTVLSAVPTDTAMVSGHLEPRMSRAGLAAEPVDAATIHLGADIFVATGTVVTAPYRGEVVTASDGVTLTVNDGTALILRGLTATVTDGRVEAGEALGFVDGRPCEPDGPAHLHVALGAGVAGDPPAFVGAHEAAGWATVAPDPLPAVLPPLPPATVRASVDDALAVRSQHIARSQRAYYQRPMTLVRGDGVWFTDDLGRRYLDAVNNVTHLGHGHPAVVAAASRQLRRLNTNSRFVYRELASYAQRLVAVLPDPLDVVFLVCTGSEANDLALRIARAVTGRTDVVVIDGAYHGNTTAVTAISPNRYKGPGGTGTPPGTWEVPTPDRYQGPFGYDDPAAGEKYAGQARQVVAEMVARGAPPAAVIAESLMGTAGQIVHPPGYLAGLFAVVRSAGGLCISDEVQVGFGRLGDAFWGFETGKVVPDLVTLGKPIGNGFPLAAVATTREIADAFDSGMKYFNTFGGNPVACAVGMAVLDTIESEQLQQRAAVVGAEFRKQLEALKDEHALIGDVRGQGLYLGIELVLDRAAKTPAVASAYRLAERLKDNGVITWPNGIRDNVLKIKPPMMFDESHARLFTDTVDRVLTEGW